VAIGLGLIATPAVAKPAPVTKIAFKLDAHEVAAGSDVTGRVDVLTRSGNTWAALGVASLSLRVDGVEVGTLVTDVDGHADVVYAGALEGDHVMKVVFTGDTLHKRAQRAQGFSVSATAPVTAVPAAPVVSATAGAATVALSWTTPDDGGSPITGYTVYRGDTPGSETALVPLGVVNVYDDATALSGSTYSYVVTALNAVGESVWSNEVTVTVP
jgi:fibronectin type 3 domain-containing protein